MAKDKKAKEFFFEIFEFFENFEIFEYFGI